MRYFLIVYDQASGIRLDLVPFAEAERDRALAARFAREREMSDRPDIEVVLLAAESLEDLKRTHSRYFKSLEEIFA